MFQQMATRVGLYAALSSSLDFLVREVEQIRQKAVYHHIIYAYLIENTRAFDVLQRVVQEARRGERLLPMPGALPWLETTEAFLYRDHGLPAALSLVGSPAANLQINYHIKPLYSKKGE